MKTRVILSTVAGLMMAGAASAQTYSGAGGAIPDATISNSIAGRGTATFTINVAATDTIQSLNNVVLNFNPEHTWCGDLEIILTAPNGDNVHIMSRTGNTTATGFGLSADLSGVYTFTEGGAALATAPVVSGNITAGTYARSTNTNAAVIQSIVGGDSDTYAVFNGDSVNGLWSLTVHDYGGGDVGTIADWSFDVTAVPGPGALALLGLAGVVGGRRRRA